MSMSASEYSALPFHSKETVSGAIKLRLFLPFLTVFFPSLSLQAVGELQSAVAAGVRLPDR